MSLDTSSWSDSPFSIEEANYVVNALRSTPVQFPVGHLFYSRLHKTFMSDWFLSEKGGIVLEMTFLAAQVEGNRRPTLEAMTKSHVAVDKAIESNLAHPLHHPPTLFFFNRLVLLLSIAADGGLVSDPLMQLFRFQPTSIVSSISGCFHLLSDQNAVPHLSPQFVVTLAANCMDLIRELTTWRVYEMTLPESTKTDIPMAELYKEFKNYVGTIITAITSTSLLSEVGQFCGVRCCGPPTPEGDRLVRCTLLALDNLLTFTDRNAKELRQYIKQSGLVPHFLGPYFGVVLATPGDLRTFTCRVTATLCFSIGAFQQYFSDNKYFLDALPSMQLAPATEGRDGAKAEAVVQLTRLVVNGHITRATESVLRLWRTCLNKEEQEAMANLLAHPTRRGQPFDVHSPTYAPLREMFKVSGIPAFMIRRREDRYGPGVFRGKRKGHGGRGGRGRGQGRGRGRGHGKGRGRFGGRRGCRRRKKRYAILRSGELRPPQSEEERRLALLSSDDSTSASSCDEEGEDGEAAVDTGIDLSRWRWSEAPQGVPKRYLCALSQRIVQSVPVLSPEGYVFDQKAILDYLTQHRVCPISGEPLYPQDLIVDEDLRRELDAVRFNFINA